MGCEAYRYTGLETAAVKTYANDSIEHLSWFHDHLHTLARLGSAVNMTIYVTSEQPVAAHNNRICTIDDSSQDQRAMEREWLQKNRLNHEGILEVGDTNGLFGEDGCDFMDHTLNLKYERLRAEGVIHEAMQSVESTARALVAVCGPESLSDTVRDAADQFQTKSSIRIDVHCEDFGS